MLIKEGTGWADLYKPGSNIDYLMTTWKIANYENEKKTVQKANNLFHDVHCLYDGNEEMLKGLGETILGEAYIAACLDCSGDGTMRCKPDASTYYSTLRKIMIRYEKRGYKFSQRWWESVSK